MLRHIATRISALRVTLDNGLIEDQMHPFQGGSPHCSNIQCSAFYRPCTPLPRRSSAPTVPQVIETIAKLDKGEIPLIKHALALLQYRSNALVATALIIKDLVWRHIAFGLTPNVSATVTGGFYIAHSIPSLAHFSLARTAIVAIPLAQLPLWIDAR